MAFPFDISPGFDREIRDIYLQELGREVDSRGFENAARFLAGGSTPAQLREAIRRSDEFKRLHAPRPNAPAGALPTPPPGPTAEQRSALDEIKAILEPAGLGSLADFAWRQITEDASQTQAFQALEGRTEFQTRFKAVFQRRKLGLPSISYQAVLEHERAVTALFRSYDLPPGFYDSPDDFTDQLVKDKSVDELGKSLAAWNAFAQGQTPPEVRDEFRRFFGGEGNLLAYFIDPNRALPVIQRQIGLAQISGRAVRAGFGGLSEGEAGSLFEAGVTDAAAEERFGQLTRGRELLSGLPGTTESDISRSEQLGVVGGDVAAQEKVRKRARERVSAFEGGAAFSETREGVSGLGRAR